METPKILIIGSTGKVGRELLSLFVNANIPARALIRRSPANLPKNSVIEYCQGDLNDPDSMKSALQGIEKVFLLTADSPQQAAIEMAFIDLAAAQGVKHVVKLTAFVAGLEPPVSFGRQLQPIENKLKSSGMAWTILRPYMFMQNFLDFADLIAGKGMFLAPFGTKGKVGFVDVRDVASVAFGVLTGGGHESKIYEVTGPEAISFKDAAGIMSATLGKKVKYIAVPGFIGKFGMVKQGVPKWNAEMIIELSKVIKTDAQNRVTDTVEKIGGKKPYSFSEFIRDNRDVFNPQK